MSTTTATELEARIERLREALDVPLHPVAAIPNADFIAYSHQLVCAVFHAVMGHLRVKHAVHNQAAELSGSMLAAHSSFVYHLALLEGSMVNSGCPEALAGRSREQSFSNGWEEAMQSQLTIEGGHDHPDDDPDGHTIH